MWDKIKDVLFTHKNLTVMGIANLFSTAILGTFWFIIAKLVTVGDYGFLNYHIAVAMTAAAVALPGITNTVMVHSGKDPKIRSPIFTLSIISLISVSIILYFIFHNFASSLYAVGYALFGLLCADLLSRKLFSNFSKITIMQRVLSIILSLTFYYVVGIDGIILGLALSFFVYFRRFYNILKENPLQFSLLKPHRSFMINNYGIDLSRILSSQIDKLIIFPFFGFIALGNYSLASQILSIVIIIPSTVFQYILPQESNGKSFRILKITVILSVVVISILIVILAPFVLPIIFPRYTDSIAMIQIMILSIIPLTMNMMYVSKFLAMGLGRIVFIGSLIFILTQIPVIIILGHFLNVYGIALALILANISEFIYLFLQNRMINLEHR